MLLFTGQTLPELFLNDFNHFLHLAWFLSKYLEFMQVFTFDDVATSVAVLLGVVPDLRVDENVAAKVCSRSSLHVNYFYEHL